MNGIFYYFISLIMGQTFYKRIIKWKDLSRTYMLSYTCVWRLALNLSIALQAWKPLMVMDMRMYILAYQRVSDILIFK